MGRRFWLILGIWLLAPPALPSAHAQGDGGSATPGAMPPSPADFPLPTKPIELTSPDDPAPAAASPKPDSPKPARSAGAGVQDGDRDGNLPDGAAPGNSLGVPALTPAPPIDREPRAGDPSTARRTSRPRADAAIERADGPAPIDGEAESAGRLPTGKQSVAVTVEVQSPPSMNLHQPAKVRLVIRNTGTSDALQVRIRDELPEGLKYVGSTPDAKVEGSSVLNWSLPLLAAGKDSVITLQVEPVKTGAFEHGASVWFQTGSQSKARVYQPKLKVELKPSALKVLKGHAVEFKVLVTNVGDGPARDVTVTAKLSPGLRHGSGGRGSDEMVTEPIRVLAPNQTEELDPLIASAIKAGDESCTVVAHSDDVVVTDPAEAARNVQTVTVVEPKLALELIGPKQRCTETIAPYEILLRNPGTAPARKVRVTAFVPPGARLTAVPKGARYDSASRRLQWSIDELDPGGAKPKSLAFEVKVGDVGSYQVDAEAQGEGELKAVKQKLVTHVIGMPDIDLAVGERQRVIDPGGKTIFFIRLRNYGTKDATNIRLSATVSKNLTVKGGYDVPPGFQFRMDEKDGRRIVLQDEEGRGIKQLGPGKELVMGLEVEVTGAEPKVATCHVQVTHDELPEPFEDMAGVKVLDPSPRAEAADKP
jgi:uncharacterized repeat protein (TIGR01451 family)